MSYLQRRVQFLFEQIDTGKLQFSDEFARSEMGKQLIDDISAIKRLEDESVDLSTCSSLVNAFAKANFRLDYHEAELRETSTLPKLETSPQEISGLMKDYFQLIEEFFIKLTGTRAEDFDLNKFGAKLTTNFENLGSIDAKAYEIYAPKILDFQAQHTRILMNCASNLGGSQCVLGGSRFPWAALKGIQKVALYADTMFIPDPLLPWLEVKRKEEKFAEINFLRACQYLLHLKPIVDANLPYPPIVVFPSWEKNLEMRDAETQDGISQLVLNFFSHYLGHTFEDETEIISFIQGKGKQEFIEKVDQYLLFWPPGQESILPFHKALEAYKQSLQTWRSTEWLEQAFQLSPEMLVFNGILERLLPQFHVRDNALSLDAQPLFYYESYFHYFKLTAQAGNSSLSDTGTLKPESQQILQSLLDPKIAWLGNVPINDIARLREEGCNNEFRKELSIFTSELHSSSYENLDKVTNSVIRSLQSLLDKHDKEARRIEDDYFNKHLKTLEMTVLTGAALFMPSLDPLLGLAPLAPLGKVAVDVWGQIKDENKLSQSLIGILSQAAKG